MGLPVFPKGEQQSLDSVRTIKYTSFDNYIVKDFIEKSLGSADSGDQRSMFVWSYRADPRGAYRVNGDIYNSVGICAIHGRYGKKPVGTLVTKRYSDAVVHSSCEIPDFPDLDVVNNTVLFATNYKHIGMFQPSGSSLGAGGSLMSNRRSMVFYSPYGGDVTVKEKKYDKREEGVLVLKGNVELFYHWAKIPSNADYMINPLSTLNTFESEHRLWSPLSLSFISINSLFDYAAIPCKVKKDNEVRIGTVDFRTDSSRLNKSLKTVKLGLLVL